MFLFLMGHNNSQSNYQLQIVWMVNSNAVTDFVFHPSGSVTAMMIVVTTAMSMRVVLVCEWGIVFPHNMYTITIIHMNQQCCMVFIVCVSDCKLKNQYLSGYPSEQRVAYSDLDKAKSKCLEGKSALRWKLVRTI